MKTAARSLCAVLAALALAAPAAGAATNHPFQANFALNGLAKAGPFQDACGVAVDTVGDVYVADYYADQIDVYRPSGSGASATLLSTIDPVEPIDGACGLAVDASGRIYANTYHRGVLRFTPSQFPPQLGTGYGAPQTIDSGHQSTGIAVDPTSGDLYVDDRTYIARFQAPITPGAPATQIIGQQTLGDGYGVAVSAYPVTAGYIYVPDAATETVKVYDPATDTEAPIEEIDGAGTPLGGFHSLLDSAVAIEQSTGHLLVLDNLQPGFEEPAAAVDEFNSAGAYRGQLPHAIAHGEPSGIAFYGGGVYVTSGNGPLSALYAFGPAALSRSLTLSRSGTGEGTLKSNPAGIACPSACEAEYDVGATVSVTATPSAGSAFSGWSGCPSPSGPGGVNCTLQMNADRELIASFDQAPAPLGFDLQEPSSREAQAVPLADWLGSADTEPRPRRASASELAQRGKLRVAFTGSLSPHVLPRRGAAPIRVSVGARVSSTDGSDSPAMKQISIAINRNGHFDTRGLPTCSLRQIQPTTTADALAACRSALIGRGSFEASVPSASRSPFPSKGALYAFNAVIDGRPAILAHVYGTRPLPTSFTLVFQLRPSKGTFGTLLTANLPTAAAGSAYITAIELDLGRTYRSHGKRRSYLSAGCPLPRGIAAAPFPFARASLAFAGESKISRTLTRSCQVAD